MKKYILLIVSILAIGSLIGFFYTITGYFQASNNPWRNDFTIFKNQPKLIYFDSGATSQKPQSVVNAITNYYNNYAANIGRGNYDIAQKSLDAYESARQKVAKFINAKPKEIVFVRGTTEGINFVASTFGAEKIQKGDEIVITELEHNANVIPWQELAKKRDATLKFIPITSEGLLDLTTLPNLITPKLKILAITMASNALGTNISDEDLEKIIEKAHEVGARVLLDGAQAVPYRKVDVKKLNADFLVFSGHKMLAPTGVGVLYIKKQLHEEMPPYQFGGGMSLHTTKASSTYLKPPEKYEAGTPAIAQVIGLGAAIDYYNQKVDFNELEKHTAHLCKILIEGLEKIDSVKILGPKKHLKESGHSVAFSIEGIAANAIAQYLNKYGIAVRKGKHCAHILGESLGYTASVRVSFFLYNTQKEVEYLLSILKKLPSEKDLISELSPDAESDLEESCRMDLGPC